MAITMNKPRRFKQAPAMNAKVNPPASKGQQKDTKSVKGTGGKRTLETSVAANAMDGSDTNTQATGDMMAAAAPAKVQPENRTKAVKSKQMPFYGSMGYK